MLTREQLEGIWKEIVTSYSGEPALRELITTYMRSIGQTQLQILTSAEAYLTQDAKIGDTLTTTAPIEQGVAEQAELYAFNGIPYVLITRVAHEGNVAIAPNYDRVRDMQRHIRTA